MDSGDYVLVICEKPDAARRVAEALSEDGSPEAFAVHGVTAFRARNQGKLYVVCSALGHLYGISDPLRNRRVYPVFDLEWFPAPLLAGGRKSNHAARSSGNQASRIRAIASLSKDASGFVNACDFDLEGETIGYNILRYACGRDGSGALRAKFSTLTKEDILEAFGSADRQVDEGLAAAGRLRHAIDFVWGVNLSRVLSESARTADRFDVVSMGRVQGPTLAFVVDREVAVQTFVPTPYWRIDGNFEEDGARFKGSYHSDIETLEQAQRIKESSVGRTGVVSRVARSEIRQAAPPPFNLADLQHEAFRFFGYSPTKTLQVAERLYLNALISYPRTGSQKLPKGDYRALLRTIGQEPEYARLVDELLSSRLVPREGEKSDFAHPAIYPTGEGTTRPSRVEERRILDLVTRRFLACFAESAIKEKTAVVVSVGENEFVTEGGRVVSAGWLKFYGRRESAERNIPRVKEGDVVEVTSIELIEKFRTKPARYNQASLLERMEREGIGTKATRAEIISTLLDRGYVAGRDLAPTELGESLIEILREYCPQITSSNLTAEIERQLELAEKGDVASAFFESLLSSLVSQLEVLRLHEREISERIRSALSSGEGRNVADTVIGRCPVCGDGSLRIIRSTKTKKRFVGCTNYPKGCKASAPLPQRGSLRAAKEPCSACGWPVVYVLNSRRRPWRLCVNMACSLRSRGK